MTKRFILTEQFVALQGVTFVKDDNADVDTYYTVDGAVDLLNEQHEQIQELIQSSKELEEDCQSTFNAMSRKQDDLYHKNFKLKEENQRLKHNIDELMELDVEEDLLKENKDLREQLILANAFIKMIENCYEDASIEDILYMKYGEFQEELHLQMAIAKEELEE